MEIKETPLFSQEGLSVSTLSFMDDSCLSFLSENTLTLRRESSSVVEAQLLPDGIKNSQATHLILKVIYNSQPENDDFITALAHQYFYKKNQTLTDKEVQLFVVSVQMPNQETREQFSYQNTRYQGVYHSQEPLLTEIPLISLNELSVEPHNAAFKCFASLKEERQQAYKVLKQSHPELPTSLKLLLSGLSKVKGDYTNFTPKQVLDVSQWFGKK
jgi:hypothetical protein